MGSFRGYAMFGLSGSGLSGSGLSGALPHHQIKPPALSPAFGVDFPPPSTASRFASVSLSPPTLSPGGGWAKGNPAQATGVRFEPLSASASFSPPKVQPQTATPMQALTAHQAQALKLFTFTGKSSRTAQGLKLQQDFIATLKHSQDPLEQAAVAEMLGRAHSMAALPKLRKLLDPQHPVAVRTAAAQALAQIGAASHADGYLAPDLAAALLKASQQRVKHLQAEVQSSSPKTYAQQLQREKDHVALWDEVETLAQGIARLNVGRVNQDFLSEFQQHLQQTLDHENQLQGLISDKALLEETFHKQLETLYKQPLSDILENLPEDELAALRQGVQVARDSGDGKGPQPKTLAQIDQDIETLERLHTKFNVPLLGRMMSALGSLQEAEYAIALKQGLESTDPAVKAQVFSSLAAGHALNYSSDVYPSLSAPDGDLRSASFQALLHSPEQAAIQKAMELATPQGFFQAAGGFSRQILSSYVDYLSQLATHGDRFIEALAHRTINPEYSLESRQMALQVVGMMTARPLLHNISPETLEEAENILQMLSLKPTGKTDADKHAIANMAASLWAQTRDPAGICAAILLAGSPDRKISSADQEHLLASTLTALVADGENQSPQERQATWRHQVVNLLKAHRPALMKEMNGPDSPESPLSKALRHGRLQDRLAPDKPELLAEQEPLPEVEVPLREDLHAELEVLRPILTRLADSDQSPMTPLLSMRIMGLLKDQGSVKYLCNRVKDPLKGKLDWQAPLSYARDPRVAAIYLRANALAALGDIGDARGLDVMLNAMQDPILCGTVIEPLGKLAPAVNETASPAKLSKVRKMLLMVMASPDVSRSMRHVRLAAADSLFQFNGGVEALKAFAAQIPNPNFKRHALSALISNDHALEPGHPDHALIREMLSPPLGVGRLHAQGITGKGVEMAIVDGGFVDHVNKEAFQRRVKLPAQFSGDYESSHPTMVMTTAAANGKLKGVAPDAKVYSDKWPDFDGLDPMEVYKKIIQGKLRGENRVCVINNSWGFRDVTPLLHLDERKGFKAFKTVVELAEKAGIQMVFAAGNEGEELGFPGVGTLSLFGLDVDKLTGEQKKQHDYIMDKIITVGAVNTQGSEHRKDHRLAEFSSRGDSLHRKLSPTLIAPGADMMVYSYEKQSNHLLGAKSRRNPKALVNGTSFASPYVAGVIALMKQVNPQLEPADIRAILKKSAVRLVGVPIHEQGSGEIAPEAAVQMAKDWPKPSALPPCYSSDSLSDDSDSDSEAENNALASETSAPDEPNRPSALQDSTPGSLPQTQPLQPRLPRPITPGHGRGECPAGEEPSAKRRRFGMSAFSRTPLRVNPMALNALTLQQSKPSALHRLSPMTAFNSRLSKPLKPARPGFSVFHTQTQKPTFWYRG